MVADGTDGEPGKDGMRVYIPIMTVKKSRKNLSGMVRQMVGIRIQLNPLFGFLKKYRKVRIQVNGVILYE